MADKEEAAKARMALIAPGGKAHGLLKMLERLVTRLPGDWAVSEEMTYADILLFCIASFLSSGCANRAGCASNSAPSCYVCRAGTIRRSLRQNVRPRLSRHLICNEFDAAAARRDARPCQVGHGLTFQWRLPALAVASSCA